MSHTPRHREARDLLADLKLDRDAIPWTDRRVLAASLGNALQGPDEREVAVELAHILAVDPKWEVRREVASSMVALSDDEFPPLAAVLTRDPNKYVRKAAERALDLRRRGVRESSGRRKSLDQVLSQFELMEATHGKALRERARNLAMQLYEVSVAATVHDLRGILTSALAKLGRLQLETAQVAPDLTKVRDGIESIGERLVYMERFVDGMGSFSQGLTSERVIVPLTQIVLQAGEVVHDGFGTADFGVELSVSVDGEILVAAAPHLLVTALANVLKNACEAVLEADDGRSRQVSLTAEHNREAEVRIIVRDNGVGVRGEDLRELRAFVPGRTTKKGRGTGFGLPIAQRYLSAHGGTIAIESVETVGTTVFILLPTAGFSGTTE